jgi:hypothetical protein
MDKIFAPFPDGREQRSAAEVGADSFAPASGREKIIQSILFIQSNETTPTVIASGGKQSPSKA